MVNDVERFAVGALGKDNFDIGDVWTVLRYLHVFVCIQHLDPVCFGHD